MKLLTTERLPELEYFGHVQKKKTQVVLHHTVSAIGKYVDDWFKADKGKSKVAVPYVIDKNGDIFELFHDGYWAWHIGKGSSMKQNQESIGIEIVNEGPLYKRKNGKFYWWVDSAFPIGRFEYKGDVTTLDEKWRGHKYFASYTPMQVDSLLELLEHIFAVHSDIPRRCVTNFDYDRENLKFNGLVMHCNVRKDKTDLSPAFDIAVVHEMLLSLAHMDIEPKQIERMPYVVKPFELIDEEKIAKEVTPVEKQKKKKTTKSKAKDSSKKVLGESGMKIIDQPIDGFDVNNHPKHNTM